MIAILTIWLTLTATGFAALSALSRAGAREERKTSLTPAELQVATLTNARITTPKALLQ